MVFPIAPFCITTATTSDGAAIVTVGGELDLNSRAAFARELLAARGRGARTLVVDLLDVPFLDSTAVGVLAATARELRDEAGTVFVVTDSPHALRVFDLTGLSRLVRTYPTMSSALDDAEAA